MKRKINGKIYEFMFCVLPSGSQGLIYKIEGSNKIYQHNNHHCGDLDLVEFEIKRDIKNNNEPHGTNEKEWHKWYQESRNFELE